MNGEYNGLSWEMCQKYIDALPGYEHTKLVEASDVMNDDKKYYTYIVNESENLYTGEVIYNSKKNAYTGKI